MYLADDLILPLNVKPIVDASANAESRKLECGRLSDLFVCPKIVVHYLESHVVSNILHIDLESLIPDGG